jgi:hypothetical protein
LWNLGAEENRAEPLNRAPDEKLRLGPEKLRAGAEKRGPEKCGDGANDRVAPRGAPASTD